jgi:hypothetical protein
MSVVARTAIGAIKAPQVHTVEYLDNLPAHFHSGTELSHRAACGCNAVLTDNRCALRHSCMSAQFGAKLLQAEVQSTRSKE